MVKEKSSKEDDSKEISARVHCDSCNIRYITNVIAKSTIKKGEKTATKCKWCEKIKVSSFLIFDRKY